METAEVIRTDKTYKESKDKDGNDLALGTVEVRMSLSGGGPRIERFVQPLFNFMQVPLIGEHILIVKGPSVMTNSGATAEAYYYIAPIAVHGNKHLNPMPDAFAVDRSGSPSGVNYASNSGPKSTTKVPSYKPGENFKEVGTVKNIQPYEGDILIEGRHGQSIRLSSGLSGPASQYSASPFWKGDQGTPITVISNGHKSQGGTNKFIIENPDDTDSIIILSSKQKIQKLKASQSNLGTGVKPISSYNKPQVIISSNRLHFNSTVDEIILSTKKDVIISTPNWAMKMDELYTEIEKLVDGIIKMQHMTGVGPSSPPMNIGTFIKIQSKIKSMKQ